MHGGPHCGRPPRRRWPGNSPTSNWCWTETSALENGASNRALRLFERALRVQPNGAEALAGLGYVNLDRQRSEAAISYFRRALTVSPYAPAMFGLGEAYRALGDKQRALEAYQRYLSTSASGADAPAARRQIKTLGERDRRRAPSVDDSARRGRVADSVGVGVRVSAVGQAGAGVRAGSGVGAGFDRRVTPRARASMPQAEMPRSVGEAIW